MAQSWQSIVQRQATLLPYGDSNKAGVSALTHITTIAVKGEDAAIFLQNLLTNDVNALDLDQAQITGLCNPKGRVLATFYLIRRQHQYLLVLPVDLAEQLKQRLAMFIMRSKVIIEDLGESCRLIGLSTQSLPSFLPTIEQALQGKVYDQHLFIKMPGKRLRYLCITEPDSGAELITKLLSEKFQLNPVGYWQLMDIDAGLPTIFNASKEQFTPQQINLDLINGVSFKKGCYPGQEVVARLHYLGTPSRRLFRARAQTTTLPTAGSDLLDSEKHVLGQVVDAQRVNDETIELLLTLKLADADKQGFLDPHTPLSQLHQLVEES